MTTYKLVYMTSLLADAVGILGILSKSLQTQDLQYNVAIKHIKASISALEDLLVSDWPYLKKVKEFMPDECEES